MSMGEAPGFSELEKHGGSRIDDGFYDFAFPSIGLIVFIAVSRAIVLDGMTFVSCFGLGVKLSAQ